MANGAMFDSNRMKNGVFVRINADRLAKLAEVARASGASRSLLIATIAEDWLARMETFDGGCEAAGQALMETYGIPVMRRARRNRN